MRLKALPLFANVGIAETYLCDMGVDVKTDEQFGDRLKFREDETAHLESCSREYYIKKNLRKAS